MTSKKVLKSFFFLNNLRFRILLACDSEGCFVSRVVKEVDSTLNNVLIVIRKFEILGLVVSKKVGRKRLISLTDKGRVFLGFYLLINNFLDENV